MKRFLKRTYLYVFALVVLTIVLSYTNIGNIELDDKTENQTYLELGENKIRYKQLGSGQDILFIHGTPGSLEDWSSLTSKLSENYRVTAFDRLGHGYSTNKKYQYNLPDNAQLVRELISELELNQPMIVGHSYGGSTVAQLLTKHYNDELDYMIIDSPLYDYKSSLIYKLLSLPVLGKAIGLIANYTVAAVLIESGIKSSILTTKGPLLDDIIQERKNIWLQPKVLHSKAKESVNYRHDLRSISDNYESIKANVVIVTGDDPEITFKSDAIKFSEEVTTDTLVVLSNTGHYIQFDKEEAILELIDNVMNEN